MQLLANGNGEYDTGVGTCAAVEIVQKVWSSLRGSVRCVVPQQWRLSAPTSSTNTNQIQDTCTDEMRFFFGKRLN